MWTSKNRVRWTAGVTGAVALALLVAMTTMAEVAAQGPGGGRNGRGRGGPGELHAGGGPGPGGGFRGAGPAALLRLPSLTDAQRDQLRTLGESRREEMGQLTRRVADARRALQTSAEAGQVDESKAVELGTATTALAVARARLHSEALAILTPEQRAELSKRREQMRQWMEARPGKRNSAR